MAASDEQSKPKISTQLFKSPHIHTALDYFHQSYRILTDVITRPRVIVAEAVVIQPRLNVLILTLILKRNEGGIIVALPSFSAEDVKLLLPYLVAVVVKCLQGSTKVVRHDGVSCMESHLFLFSPSIFAQITQTYLYIL